MAYGPLSRTRRGAGSITRAHGAAMIGGTLARVASHALGSAFKKMTSGSTAPAGLTSTENSNRVVYSRKRPSRSGRRRAVRQRKFARRVVIAGQSILPKQKVLFNTITTQSNAANVQSMATTGFTLNGNLTGSGSERDLIQIATSMGSSAAQPKKIQFKGCQLETVVKNTGSNGLYLELYYLNTSKNTPIADSTYATICQAGLNTAQLPGGTTLNNSTVGVVPFQSLKLTQMTNIVKKVVVKLAPGESFDFVMKNGRKFTYDSERHAPYGYLRGITTTILMVCYGDLDAVGNTSACSYATNSSRSYIAMCEGFDISSCQSLAA